MLQKELAKRKIPFRLFLEHSSLRTATNKKSKTERRSESA